MATIRNEHIADWCSGPYYQPGQCVPPGRYYEVETHREVVVIEGDLLPANCNGHAAAYVRKAPTWDDVIDQRSARN